MMPPKRDVSLPPPTHSALQQALCDNHNDEYTLHSISTALDLSNFNECKYKTLNGSIRVTGSGLLTTGSIAGLEKVLGKIEIITSSTLESLTFPDLIEVQKSVVNPETEDGSIQLLDLARFKENDPFPKLAKLQGSFSIQNLPALRGSFSLKELNAAESVSIANTGLTEIRLDGSFPTGLTTLAISNNKNLRTFSSAYTGKDWNDIEILGNSEKLGVSMPNLEKIRNLTTSVVEGLEVSKLNYISTFKLNGYTAAPKYQLPATSVDKLSITNVSLGSDGRLSDQFKALEELKGLEISASSKIPVLEFPSLKRLGGLFKEHTLSISNDSTVGSLLFPSLEKMNGSIKIVSSCFNCEDLKRVLGVNTSSLDDFYCSSSDQDTNPTCQVVFGKDALSKNGTTSSPKPPEQNKTVKTGFIGGVVGGIILLFIVLSLLWRRRQKLRRSMPDPFKTETSTGTSGKSNGSKATTSTNETGTVAPGSYSNSHPYAAENSIIPGHKAAGPSEVETTAGMGPVTAPQGLVVESVEYTTPSGSHLKETQAYQVTDNESSSRTNRH